MLRRPDSYVGLNHTTIGSDILAVFRAVHSPAEVLGADLTARVKDLDPAGWYPIDLLQEIFAALDAKLGRPALVAMGWAIVQSSHAETIRKSMRTAQDLVQSLDAIYRAANKGHRIGGWKVLSFEPGTSELEKTTPHHCVVEEGILEEGLRIVGVKAEITQPRCFRQGAGSCHYVIRSPIRDARWQSPP